MTFEEVAKLVLKYFPLEAAPTMLAIARAESALNEDTIGDSPQDILEFYEMYRPSEITQGEISAQRARDWNGVPPNTPEDETTGVSIGLYQINIYANWDIVMKLSGITFPTLATESAWYRIPANENDVFPLKAWLQIPENNVKAARSIWDRQGFQAWTVYNQGFYVEYLDRATQAINQVLSEMGEQPPIIPPITEPTPFPIGWVIASGAAAAIITIIILSVRK